MNEDGFLRVREVLEGSCAEGAGFVAGDVITELGGRRWKVPRVFGSSGRSCRERGVGCTGS